MTVLFHSGSNLNSHKSKCLQVLQMKGNHQEMKLKSVQTIASFTRSNQRYQVLHNQSKLTSVAESIQTWKIIEDLE